MAAWRAQNPVPTMGPLLQQPARVLTQMPNGTWAMKRPPKAKKKAVPAPKPGAHRNAPRIYSHSCRASSVAAHDIPALASVHHQKTVQEFDTKCYAVSMLLIMTTQQTSCHPGHTFPR